MNTNREIVADIEAYVRDRGGVARYWYAGIASKPRDRLFSDHNMSEHSDAWIYRQAISHQDARAVERYLLETVGMRGGSGGGDAATTCVYAYRISSHTIE